MDEPSRATGSLGARRVSDSPVIELIATDPRAARVVLGLFAVQLLMSIRFLFKYADARPGVLYGLFVVAALGACGVVLNVRRLSCSSPARGCLSWVSPPCSCWCCSRTRGPTR